MRPTISAGSPVAAAPAKWWRIWIISNRRRDAVSAPARPPQTEGDTVMLKSACATVALLALSNPALAAGCASPTDAAALKTAVMQQEMMVAALPCHETRAYKRFVTTYRGGFQSFDAGLETLFLRRGG